MKPKVYITGCDTYDQATVDRALEKLLSRVEGIEQMIKPGDKVFLKINLLMKKRPEEATTTHPAVVEAVVKFIQRRGGTVTIGDSPGGPYTENALKAIYLASGMSRVAERTGCTLNYDLSSRKIATDGRVTKSLDIISPVLNADKVIAIGKLKTHMLMTATLAVKLCFGYIPGLKKADYHLRMPNPKDFANLLVDIYECRKPDLNIIDAVYGMEGNGPSAGNPIKVGCLFAGINGHAVDTVGVTIMGMNPLAIPTLQCAAERGLFSGKIADVEIVGDNIGNYLKRFRSPKIRRYDTYMARLPKPLAKFISNHLQPRPVFDNSKCKGCRDCARACPAKTIEMVNNKAMVNLDNCIRCFCCHELCPHQAIEIKRPVISRFLSR